MSFTNKVYINPNFNVSQRKCTEIPSNKMHVNPKFSQHIFQNKSKIFVNPNFVNADSTNVLGIAGVAVQSRNLNKVFIQDKMEPAKNVIPSDHKITRNNAYNSPQTNLSKSRYSLIRHPVNRVTISQENVKPTTTMQLNKYKSVAISKYKTSLDTTKVTQCGVIKPSCSSARAQKPLFNKFNNTNKTHARVSLHYPQITTNQVRPSSESKFVYRKFATNISQTELKSRNVKLKVIKRSFKKNNIPCPLFRKYGMCLRSTQGNCDFSHDKKHVSLCRKFIKGICHETNCLLSHDMTSNKMPTCYFYLRGMCTKDNCPYLHVKLNNETKVCPEFLKGYCENGDKCLKRHVGTLKHKTNNKRLKKLTCSLKQKKIKTYKLKEQIKEDNNSLMKNIEVNTSNPVKPPNIDSRYYNEAATSAEDNVEPTAVIKPTRCKLGTLPSFIKF